MKRVFYFWAMAAVGEGVSGSDRIFIEFARRWQKKHPVNIFLWEDGVKMCKRMDLQESPQLKFKLISSSNFCKFGFFICYFVRIILAILKALTLKLDEELIDTKIVVYSTSEFLMDSLPAFVLKLRYHNVIWVAAWYQTAPNPIKGFSEGNRKNLYRYKAFLYWFSQVLVKPIISHYADFILINNQEEKRFFKDPKKLKIVLGAVDLERIDDFIKSHKQIKKRYDGVFQGRFHPQKGVLELIEIWKQVVSKKSTAKLVMIGDGPLFAEVKHKIKEYGLEKNVNLLGYVFDGEKKYKVFSESLVVMHPSFYDSGGMASAEAMAFKLPCVGFDLIAYKTYYPHGMLKAKLNNLNEFSELVIKLLSDKTLYKRTASEGYQMIRLSWSWDSRAQEVLEYITR